MRFPYKEYEKMKKAEQDAERARAASAGSKEEISDDDVSALDETEDIIDQDDDEESEGDE